MPSKVMLIRKENFIILIKFDITPNMITDTLIIINITRTISMHYILEPICVCCVRVSATNSFPYLFLSLPH